MSEQNGRRLSVAARSRCGWGLCYPAQRTHGELTGNMDQGDVSRATGGGIRSNLLRRRRSPVGVRLPWRRSRMKLERRSSYRVSGPLTPGGCVSYRNRRYRLLDISDHITRHGHNTQLLKWGGVIASNAVRSSRLSPAEVGSTHSPGVSRTVKDN